MHHFSISEDEEIINETNAESNNVTPENPDFKKPPTTNETDNKKYNCINILSSIVNSKEIVNFLDILGVSIFRNLRNIGSDGFRA